MKKAQIGKLVMHVGLAITVSWFIYTMATFYVEISNENNINYVLPAWANLLNGTVFLLYMIWMIAPVIIVLIGGAITGSALKTSIGKVFIIEKVRADKHSGIVRYQNVKMTVHSSEDLAIGDHVKVTGTERVYAGRYRTTIFLAKKLDINDPEYNNVESETDNTNTLAGFT